MDEKEEVHYAIGDDFFNIEDELKNLTLLEELNNEDETFNKIINNFHNNTTRKYIVSRS